MLLLSNLVPPAGERVNSKTLLSPEPCLMNCPCIPILTGLCPSCGAKGIRWRQQVFLFLSPCCVSVGAVWVSMAAGSGGILGAALQDPSISSSHSSLSSCSKAKGLYLGQGFPNVCEISLAAL